MSKIHQKWLVVASVLFGTFTVILNNSMLNPTLPTFMEMFQVDAVAVSWILTIYMVATGMTMPLTGFLGDRYGKKRTYIAGLIIFMAGSLGTAMSPNLSMIIIFRAIQGMAGGLMMAIDRKSTRLNSSHVAISYAVFCLDLRCVRCGL